MLVSWTLLVGKRSFHALSHSNASFKVECFLACCSMQVTPWINQSTLNGNMTTWRGFKRINLSLIHIVHVQWCANLSFMMTFALVMIGPSKTSYNVHECPLVFEGEIYFTWRKKWQSTASAAQHVCIRHEPRPLGKSMTGRGNASQIRGSRTKPNFMPQWKRDCR